MNVQNLFVALWKQLCERAVRQLAFREEETVEVQK